MTKLQMTELQRELATEMYNQGVDRPTLNWSMRLMKTQKQQEKLLNFMKEIRDKEITQHKLITKVEEIEKEED